MQDERFSTPRATALSSRSNCSQSSDASSHERWHTPRYSVSSARSAASFETARSSFQSPIENVQIQTRNFHAADRDRTRDFRRFSDRDHSNSYRRPPSAIERRNTYQSSYDLAETGGNIGREARVGTNPIPRRQERNQDIFSLARHGRAGELEELLLQGVSVESKDENGNTILLTACQNGSKKVVKLALRYGADIDAINSSRNTALHFAFKYGFGESLGGYLISKGANTKIRNNEGRTYAEV